MIPELAAAAAGISAAMFYAAAVPSSQVFGPALVSAPGARGRFAFTFDDGPSESTPALLDVLAQHGARATFFFCGENVRRLPKVARRAAAEGHEIGNHTQTHPRLFLCSPRRIRQELETAQGVLQDTVGGPVRLFRPPYGARWFGLYPALQRLELSVVMWSVCVYDWSRPAPAIEAGLVSNTRDGSVVLLHDGDTITPGDRRSATVAGVSASLPALVERGLRPVTVSELFNEVQSSKFKVQSPMLADRR